MLYRTVRAWDYRLSTPIGSTHPIRPARVVCACALGSCHLAVALKGFDVILSEAITTEDYVEPNCEYRRGAYSGVLRAPVYQWIVDYHPDLLERSEEYDDSGERQPIVTVAETPVHHSP